ncbi:MAG: hypothetical protein ACRDPC_29280, partial [Solirubrobacteraceae bacterium]
VGRHTGTRRCPGGRHAPGEWRPGGRHAPGKWRPSGWCSPIRRYAGRRRPYAERSRIPAVDASRAVAGRSAAERVGVVVAYQQAAEWTGRPAAFAVGSQVA